MLQSKATGMLPVAFFILILMTKDKKKKIEFSWDKGSRLSPDMYDALGNVRDVGFTKLADGIYADPQLRKKQRKNKLSQPPQSKKDENLIFEESQSGLNEEYTPSSETSRLLHGQKNGLKGIFTFKNPKSKKDK